MSEQFKPDAEFLISDLEALKVISDPFRLRIIETMSHEPMTVKRIAAKLKVSPKKLYYHVKLLEKHGLIVVVDTQLVSGIVEKWYMGKARAFVVDKRMLVMPGEGEREGKFEALDQLVTTIFRSTQNDILDSARQGLIQPDKEDPRQSNMLLMHGGLKLRPGRRAAFVERWHALCQEFKDESAEDGDEELQPYGLTIALYPAAGHRDEDGQEE